MRHLTRVLLPAPFPPRSAWKVPGWTVMEMSSSATRGPKRLATLSISIFGGGVMAGAIMSPSGQSSPRLGGAPLQDCADETGGRCARTEDAVLHFDHPYGGVVVGAVGGGAAVF